MTPEERNLVIDLFDRLATLEDAQRDPEAERLIRDGQRQAPNATYALVQTVLVQDEAIRQADARIRELESAGGAPPRDTSFLGGMRDSLFGSRESRGCVPSVRQDAAPAGISPAWQSGAQTMPGSYGSGPPPGAAPGGSFLGTAAAAAAGVIGGSLLLGGIRSAMGQQSGSSHAAFDPGAGGSSPWSGGGGGDLSRQAGLDDIGRGSGSGSGSGSRGYGLLDESSDAAGDDPAADDLDDGDFDVDGGDDGGDE